MHRLKCSEVWGGIKDKDQEARSAGLAASLYSSSCEGGKGGDIYYFSVCDNDMLTRIAVADVVGHGSAVSDVSKSLYEALKNRMNDLDGSQVLADLNAYATERGLAAMTTASIVAYYTRDAFGYFARAGHHPPLLRRWGRRTWRALLPALERPGEGLLDMPLGVLHQTGYQQQRVRLDWGDRLLLYTDGLIEAPSPDGQRFGLERLHAVLDGLGEASLGETKAAVLDAVKRHSGGPLVHDDVTIVVIEVL